MAGPGVVLPPRDPDAARAVLRRAVALGVDHVDTSQYYGPDVVNDLMGEALHPYPKDLKLVTKVGWRRDEVGSVLPHSGRTSSARGSRRTSAHCE
jgi:pyridoxine 4-dehydrogenase